MKRTLIGKLAMVALLVLGSVSMAQEVTPVADIQASVSDNVVVQGEIAPAAVPVSQGLVMQSSDCIGCSQTVSAPVFQPALTSGCTGCGTAVAQQTFVSQPSYVSQPTFAAQPYAVSQAYTAQPCNSCGSGVAQVSYQEPLYQSVQSTTTPAISASATIVNPAPQPAMVTYPQPTTTYAQPTTTCCGGGAVPTTTYAPAPVVSSTYVPQPTVVGTPVVNSGCTSCGTTQFAPQPVTYSTCNGCQQPQRRVLGRVLNRR